MSCGCRAHTAVLQDGFGRDKTNFGREVNKIINQKAITRKRHLAKPQNVVCHCIDVSAENDRQCLEKTKRKMIINLILLCLFLWMFYMGVIIFKRENPFKIEIVDRETLNFFSMELFIKSAYIGIPIMCIGFILFWTSEYGWQNLEWLPMLKRK